MSAEDEPGRHATESCTPLHAPVSLKHTADHLHPAPHTHSVHGVEGHRPQQRRALLFSLLLTAAAMVAELAGAWITQSLMLLSDAAHMLSHGVSLGVSYLAIRFAGRPRTPRSHYGFYRGEILGSLFNGITLVAFTVWIVVAAVERLQAPVAIRTGEMLAVALFGLGVNVGTLLILHRSGAEDLNTRSALLHMLGDLFSSIVIVAGGLVLLFTEIVWLDPVLSLVVALVVLFWGAGLVRRSVSILLERAPRHLEPSLVANAMRSGVPGVKDVHDLHVWEITSGYVCLTAHVVVEDGPVSETASLRQALCNLLWERFQVAHVTLQMEATRS